MEPRRISAFRIPTQNETTSDADYTTPERNNNNNKISRLDYTTPLNSNPRGRLDYATPQQNNNNNNNTNNNDYERNLQAWRRQWPTGDSPEVPLLKRIGDLRGRIDAVMVPGRVSAADSVRLSSISGDLRRDCDAIQLKRKELLIFRQYKSLVGVGLYADNVNHIYLLYIIYIYIYIYIDIILIVIYYLYLICIETITYYVYI